MMELRQIQYFIEVAKREHVQKLPFTCMLPNQLLVGKSLI